MIRHVFRLVWNRKRATVLVLVEILVCFLVLCGMLATGLNWAIQWRKPLGFDYHDVWSATISGMQFGGPPAERAGDRQAIADMLRAVGAMAEVESVAVSTNTPYSGSTWTETSWIDGRPVNVLWTLSSADLPRVLQMELLDGRWLAETDAALGYRPVLLTRNLAEDMFGEENPVGRDMPVYDLQGRPTEPEDSARVYRVVGVVENYRRRGMVEETPYAMFVALDLVDGESVPEELLVRVRPGTTAAFEEQLVRTLQGIAPRWSYDTVLLEARRRSTILTHLLPMLMTAVVAGFLIIMVGLGLVGVLWLSVTRRTAELGLRRAMGASTLSVRRQIVGELWALTATAVAVGAVIFLQLPLVGVNFGGGWPVFLGGTLLATLVLYSFVTICGLYPAWLATRVQPAVALQHE